jgi:hypothetical protein
LLDVQFQIGGRIAAFSASITNAIDVDDTVPQSVLQSNSLAIGTNTVDVDGVRTRKCRRPKEAPAKTRTFLIGPIDQPNRDRWPAMKFLTETPQHLKTGKNTQAPV